MNLKLTHLKIVMLIAFSLIVIKNSRAGTLTYCSPAFSGGCTFNNNNNKSVTLGTINWVRGTASCSLFDYTNLSTTLDTSVAYPMAVENGPYCGVGVWIDFDQNQAFDSYESLFHQYAVSSTGDTTYSFNITIPPTVYSGTYRMRVVAGWGSDCFTPSANGYGPCGSYMYGNFDDFTVIVNGAPVGITKMVEKPIASVEVFPNPASASVTVLMKNYSGNHANLRLESITGKIIRSYDVMNEREVLDISDLSKGIYFLRYEDGIHSEYIRFVK